MSVSSGRARRPRACFQAVPLGASLLAAPALGAAQPAPVDSVYLVPAPGSGSHAWYVNQPLRHGYEVYLLNVPSERACRQRKVQFVATQGVGTGKDALSPPTYEAVAEWVAEPSGVGRCRAVARWRLGDIPGSQELVARLLRPDTSKTVPDAVLQREGRLAWRAYAHMPPTIVAGFAYLDGPAGPIAGTDSSMARRGQPFFGVEFVPLFSPTQVFARLTERIRLTLGTSYRQPGFDFYVGLSPLALLDGLRTTGMPIQITAGHRWSARGHDTYFVGATANALSLLKDVVGKF